MKKLNTVEAQNILALHYLPGLRYAIELLSKEVSLFEGTTGTHAIASDKEDEDATVLPMSSGRKRRFSSDEKRQVVAAINEHGYNWVHKRTNIARSALVRWRKEFA